MMQGNTNEKQDLAALAADATPGPWRSEQDFGADCPECGEGQMAEAFVIKGATHGGVCVVLRSDFSDADARFIAACRTGVPAMTAELDALRARVAELEAEVARLTTLRPMSEAPRDEPVLLKRITAPAYVSGRWVNERWDVYGSMALFYGTFQDFGDSDFSGWLPLPAPAPEAREE